MKAAEMKVITEARDMALNCGKDHAGRIIEYDFLAIAQKLDEILRPELIRELRESRERSK
jgi:hypothetical protein